MSRKRHRPRSRVLDPAEAGQDWGEISAAMSASGMPDASRSGTRAPGASASRARAAGTGPSHPDASLPVPGQDAVVRRTADGWRVGDDDLPDLTCAMVLADLLAAELPTEIQPAVPPAPPAPVREQPVADEARRLRTTVGQLEHALTARIRIEQAIGVLAERHRIRPRQAFE